MTEFIIPEQFEQQARECLAHLYDYAFLQDHPLVYSLTPDIQGAQRVQVFRQLIIDAVETFRPGGKVDFHSRQARTYNMLLLRYIEGLDATEVQQQLALSERQFYREHRRATEAISRVLWERTQQDHQSSEAEPSPSGSISTISVQSELRRVRSESINADIPSFLDGVRVATQSLADQRGIRMDVLPTVTSEQIEVDIVSLRQALILIVARLLARSQGVLTLQGLNAPNMIQITISVRGDVTDAESIEAMFAQQETLQYLMQSLESDLSFVRMDANGVDITLTVPSRRRFILVIDDNPDVIGLFKRYLVGQLYHLLTANEGEQAIEIAREEQPDIIILDIMMPGKDGWEILQNLKNHPTTKHIPVMICSVLDAPDVAYSLGANDYLSKPPGQADFLTALARWRG